MTHFIEKRDPWGNGLAMWVVVVLIFAAPLGWLAVKQSRLEHDIEKWLPENAPETTVLRWAQQQFPMDERVYVTWDGSSLNDPRVDLLIEKLAGRPDADGIRRGGLPHVASVVEPRQLLASMQQQEVEPQEAVRRLEGVLLGAGSLKLRLTEFGKARLRRTRHELTAAAKSRFGIDLIFSDPVPDFATLVTIPAPAPAEGEQPAEPAAPAVLSVEGKLLEGETVDHDLQVIWRGIRPASAATRDVAEWLTQFVPPKNEGQTLVERCFFAPGSPVSMALSISEAGMADTPETIEAIRIAALSVGIPSDDLHLSGSAVAATEFNSKVRQEAWDRTQPLTRPHRRSALLASALVVAGLTFLLNRNLRLATSVLAVSLYATFLSMALVPALGGSMNVVIAVLPTVLMAFTLSGATHVVNSWKIAAGENAATALVAAIRTSRIPCALAGLVMACCLVPLCMSSLAPFRELGFCAVVGTVLSLVMVLYALPALLHLWPGKPPTEHELDYSGWRWLGRGLTAWPVLQSLIFAAICVGCSYGLTMLRTETKVIRYFPENSRVTRDYWFIESHLAGITPVETIVRFDTRAQQEINFIDRMEVVREITERMRAHTEITGAVSLPDFQPASEQPDAEAGFIAKGKFTKRANALQEQVRDEEILAANGYYNVAEEAHDLSVVGDNLLNEPGDELWRITAHVAVMTDNDFTRIVSDMNQLTKDVLRRIPGSMHSVTGTVPLFQRTQQETLQSLAVRFGLVFVLILGVFMVMLRSIPAGLVAMIPIAVPIAAVFGVSSWMGQTVNSGTMIAASIALAVATDGTLHFLSWMQLGMKNGQSRRDAIVHALVNCGPARWQVSLAVAMGLLVLGSAELLLISRFSGFLAAMIGVTLAGNLVFLPQLLASPLGYLFEPTKLKTQDVSAASVEGFDRIGGQTVETPDSTAGSPPPPHLRSLKPNRENRLPAS